MKSIDKNQATIYKDRTAEQKVTIVGKHRFVIICFGSCFIFVD